MLEHKVCKCPLMCTRAYTLYTTNFSHRKYSRRRANRPTTHCINQCNINVIRSSHTPPQITNATWKLEGTLPRLCLSFKTLLLQLLFRSASKFWKPCSQSECYKLTCLHLANFSLITTYEVGLRYMNCDV